MILIEVAVVVTKLTLIISSRGASIPIVEISEWQGNAHLEELAIDPNFDFPIDIGTQIDLPARGGKLFAKIKINDPAHELRIDGIHQQPGIGAHIIES